MLSDKPALPEDSDKSGRLKPLSMIRFTPPVGEPIILFILLRKPPLAEFLYKLITKQKALSMAADIDINFSFTNDTKNYWEVFDRQKSSQNCPDPDYYSPRLRTYHQKLWSKKLPNGEMMELKEDANYLVWKDFHFGSDSIVNMYFHHIKAQKSLTDEIKKSVMPKIRI